MHLKNISPSGQYTNLLSIHQNGLLQRQMAEITGLSTSRRKLLKIAADCQNTLAPLAFANLICTNKPDRLSMKEIRYLTTLATSPLVLDRIAASFLSPISSVLFLLHSGNKMHAIFAFENATRHEWLSHQTNQMIINELTEFKSNVEKSELVAMLNDAVLFLRDERAILAASFLKRIGEPVPDNANVNDNGSPCTIWIDDRGLTRMHSRANEFFVL